MATAFAPAYKFQARNKNNEFLQKVLSWMFVGLLVSAFAAFAVFNIPALAALVSNPIFFWSAIIAEVIIVIVLSWAMEKLSVEAAIAGFLIYALLTGLTLSLILMLYSFTTIGLALVTAAGMFGAAAIYGYYTKQDLSTFGLVLFMILIGVIIATIINMFVQSSGLNMVLNYLVVFVFAGLTAYDLYVLKKDKSKGEIRKKAAILGALMLYLNFINMFLALLEIFGDRN